MIDLARRSRAFRRALVVLVCLGSVFAFPSTAAAQGFSDDFSSPVLDPAWMVFPGEGNAFSTVERPGFLRYRLTPFTHDDGFINGFLPTVGYHSCCTHVSGVELHRMFGGDRWTFETRVEYFMPFANGRRLGPRVYFGTGGPGTIYVHFDRTRDVHPINILQIRLMEKFGPTLNDQAMLEYFALDLGGFGPAESTHYLRLDRDGGVLTAMYSSDGVSWNTAWSHDFGNQLDGLPQRVVLPGLSWAVPAGSYVDYDYVRVTPAGPGPPAHLTLEPAAKTNEVGTQHCVTATVTDAEGAPVPDVTVRFMVSGAHSTSGSATTDANGQARFCYTGTRAGPDRIQAYADTDSDSFHDPGEPFGVAAKIWTCPPGHDDLDDDGLDDKSEDLFGTLLNDVDSDDDGIRDGNDDGDDDGEDDEDEDDGADPCPEDGDGDGEDDEDEDDD
jgi:Bacterial Ig-like domain (group 1)